MLGAHRACDLDEIGGGEPQRLREHRTGHHDVLVFGQASHHRKRGIGDRRELAGQFGARLALDLVDQHDEHIVEQTNVIVGEPVRSVQEQRRDPPQRFRAPLVRTVTHDALEFGYQRRGRGH